MCLYNPALWDIDVLYSVTKMANVLCRWSHWLLSYLLRYSHFYPKRKFECLVPSNQVITTQFHILLLTAVKGVGYNMIFLGTSSANGAREAIVQHPYILVQAGTPLVAMLIEIVESTLIKYQLSKKEAKEKTVKGQKMQYSSEYTVNQCYTIIQQINMILASCMYSFSCFYQFLFRSHHLCVRESWQRCISTNICTSEGENAANANANAKLKVICALLNSIQLNPYITDFWGKPGFWVSWLSTRKHPDCTFDTQMYLISRLLISQWKHLGFW